MSHFSRFTSRALLIVALAAAMSLLHGCTKSASTDGAEQYYPQELLVDPQTRFALVEEYVPDGIARLADYTHAKDCEDVARTIRFNRAYARTFCVPYR